MRNRIETCIAVLGTIAFSGAGHAQSDIPPYSFALCQPPKGAAFVKGVIPDAATASRVALDILTSLYGRKMISRQLPFNIREERDRYIVIGVLPAGAVGGNASMVLCRANGAVLYLSHSK